jgi:hypothetical protein
VEQLVHLVQDYQGQTLKVKFVRDGKEQVREVKPGKRPEAARVEQKTEVKGKVEKAEINRYEVTPVQPGIRWRTLEVAPKAGAGPQGGSGTMQLYTIPNAVPGSAPTGGSAYPPATSAQPMMARLTMALPAAQLPDDMEVTISRKGNKPAVVVAKQGDKLWKTTENELGMLPPAAQAYAAKMLDKDVLRTRVRGGATGMGGGMGMPGMSGMPGMPGMAGMPGLPGIPGASSARREVRTIELRLDKDGKVEAVQSKNSPDVKVLPGGGFQIEIRDEAEGKEGKKEGKSDKPAAAKEDPERARRIRQLQEQAEQLRAQLNKLREEAKEKEKE